MSKTKNSMGNNKDYSSASSYTSSSLSSDEEEIDARDLKPIRDYLSDRKELARQLFRSVKPEKIRLMLPQVLKHMDLDELEEWCESELNGMSKARIVSILNGKPMLESSDTSESSDDSGPSLEIISDTEEWLTDDDTLKKENSGKGKIKKDKTKIKGKINKKNNVNKSNVKGKCNIKNENNDKTEIIEIKKEDDKGKEGDSLLDLLELEMRARAIRALIRKEEDIIPSINPSQTNDSQTTENDVGTSHDYKTKENYREQLERIISSQQNSKGEDEDVVLVIPKPAPVVELLSSDSDGEAVNNLNENERNSTKSSQDVKERKETQEIIEIHGNLNMTTKTHLTNTSEAIMPERNVDIKNNTLSISISADNVAERRKKSKKKSRGKSQLISTIEKSSESKEINVIETTEQSHNKDIKITSRTNSSDENNMIVEEENKTSQKITEESKIEEERLTDLDEIDLDDYCEVMDIENSDEDKSQDKVIAPSQQENKQPVSQTALPKLDSAETWASRYYQTDDVQNVIKESKIQSEIRKRLRERQRLSKLNKSPNLNLSAQPSTTDAPTTLEKAPTGSVEEYLALKRSLNTNVSTNNNNNIPQDNLTAVNTDNDIKAKDTVIQDENISCNQECIDNDNTPKVIASETVIDKSADTVGDIKNDT
ncbi:TNF receptor-associated factor family protein DDB_G0272098 isoform X1 [Pogonomyrmex barbatus]|uniref:TNF receptor-associated factor family protein DDB_G0272098 isoform X1 n=2 Tax=Pogonomyrmex barbatus TaxID=144034 RepID=A0A6I9VZW7_9HYME|nr:TNF receptor-associated factor family protein DDB_G0272098 isoform X1 [Pogonomyrmex barbatus]XP_011634880.1 TNF receptor-associated factor family protein DDB_G0272098 isoform X1 [Pogonomyrmex barbatus]XP_011634881.1 TNF receptor-associated factor family protein DDB_G0272098 isoform X1 [Pogonomyrmex barbatus]